MALPVTCLLFIFFGCFVVDVVDVVVVSDVCVAGVVACVEVICVIDVRCVGVVVCVVVLMHNDHGNTASRQPYVC